MLSICLRPGPLDIKSRRLVAGYIKSRRLVACKALSHVLELVQSSGDDVSKKLRQEEIRFGHHPPKIQNYQDVADFDCNSSLRMCIVNY